MRGGFYFYSLVRLPMLWEKEGAFSIFQNFRCDIPDFQYVAMKRLSLSRRRNYSSKTYDFAGRSKTHLMEQEASKTGNRIWGKWNNCNFRSNVNGLSVVGERGGGDVQNIHTSPLHFNRLNRLNQKFWLNGKRSRPVDKGH